MTADSGGRICSESPEEGRDSSLFSSGSFAEFCSPEFPFCSGSATGDAVSAGASGSSELSPGGAGASETEGSRRGARRRSMSAGRILSDAAQKTGDDSPGSRSRNPSISGRGCPSGNTDSETGSRADTDLLKQVSVAIWAPDTFPFPAQKAKSSSEAPLPAGMPRMCI